MKKFILIVLILTVLGAAFIAFRPGDASQSCQEFYAGMENPPTAALDWCKTGEYFSWESTLPVNAGFEPLNIFHVCQGNLDNPAILMIHGYPNSSFDYALLFRELSKDYYICALDTPGYGFSDKPRDGYDYSIFDDARLVDEYIREVAGLDEFILYTHDKGDSVGLALLQIYWTYDEKPYSINHLFITNGNIYLPLAQLKFGQKVYLNPTTGPLLSSLISGSQFSKGNLAKQLSQGEIDAYVSILDYQDGTDIRHEIIEYLNDRTENEIIWLETLEKSAIPVTIIWGELDTVAPVTVPNDVWENFLDKREAPATYWRIPCADHYPQVNEPELVTAILHATLANDLALSEIDGANCQALKIH